MEQLLNFFAQYGLWISIFAVVGIAILGVLKYCNLFTKIEESKRLNTRLETLLKLTEITNDEKTLNIIKDLVTKIKEEL